MIYISIYMPVMNLSILQYYIYNYNLIVSRIEAKNPNWDTSPCASHIFHF